MSSSPAWPPAFALGQNLPVKLLFWQLDDAPGQGLVVSKDSGIDSYRDLKKAKAIGTPSGTCAQVALGLMARKAGIAMKELNVVNIARRCTPMPSPATPSTPA
ncbi:transport system periplasmic protein [Bordetella pertussis]|nr:transport system periplasmic protein [Bordetella pertussis]